MTHTRVVRLMTECLAALNMQPTATFEPWSVENSKLGWRYHLCGSHKRRQLPLLTLRTGCTLANSCATVCADRFAGEGPSRSRSGPSYQMAPRVREMLENLTRQLLRRLQTLPASEGRCFVTDVARFSALSKLLVTGLARPTCAVVGSSPLLLSSSHGAEIDEHDVVFRFNFAPSTGYSRSVGRRTTVRVMGRSWVWNESRSTGDHLGEWGAITYS
jgi:hypothetical protein